LTVFIRQDARRDDDEPISVCVLIHAFVANRHLENEDNDMSKSHVVIYARHQEDRFGTKYLRHCDDKKLLATFDRRVLKSIYNLSSRQPANLRKNNMKPVQRIGALFLLLAISGSCASQTSQSPSVYTKQTRLYIGRGSCNNGEITINADHKGCATEPIGYTIDAADAQPENHFVELFAGNDTMNMGIVSPDEDHGGGSTESIGYVSKRAIRGGVRIRAGNGSRNNGIATLSTRHLGDTTRVVGYALPLK
jgi:hypothetical protein